MCHIVLFLATWRNEKQLTCNIFDTIILKACM